MIYVLVMSANCLRIVFVPFLLVRVTITVPGSIFSVFLSCCYLFCPLVEMGVGWCMYVECFFSGLE